MDKKDIKSMNLNELKEEIATLGEKPFRAKQIYEWIHVKLVDDLEEMTNISEKLRTRLKEGRRWQLTKIWKRNDAYTYFPHRICSTRYV